MKVIIAGAGIGGLTLALMLHERGIESHVFERVEQLRPLGVGINLLPHAAQAMKDLGLLDALAQDAIETTALHYYNQYGQPIWTEPRGVAAGYEVPQLSIHRGELQMSLAQAVYDRLGTDHVHTGMEFESVVQDADGVTVTFRDRKTGTTHNVRGDVLVGADGIHSAVRRFFFESCDRLRFSGRMLWRGVTDATPYLDGRTMFMAGHQDQKFVCYPISEPLRRSGRSRINWIAELRVDDDELPATDWNRVVPASTFANRFSDWRWDWIDIPGIIEDAEAIYEFPLVDKDPLPGWTQGRSCLLGDAAHPMYPIGSNGSAQAILDARCLADLLGQIPGNSHGTVELALKEYEAERLPVTAGIVLRNRLNGPEQVMQIAHERAPQGFNDVHDVISQKELEEIAMRYKRLAGFAPQAAHVHSDSPST